MYTCRLSLGRGWIDLAPLNTALFSFSYAEVRAERRRAFGLEELSPPEIAPSSVKVTQKPNRNLHIVRHLHGRLQSDPPSPTLLCVPGSGALSGHLLHAGRSAGQEQRCTFGVLPQLPEVLPHGAVRLCM